MLVILDPRDAKPLESRPLSPRPKSLAGKTIGLRNVLHREDFTLYTHLVAQALERQFHAAKIVRLDLPLFGSRMTAEELDAFSGKVDAAIVGVAGWGQTTMGCVHDATELEHRGTPAVIVATQKYQPLAQLVAAAAGYPVLPMVTLSTSFEVLGQEQVEALVRQTLGAVVKSLTHGA